MNPGAVIPEGSVVITPFQMYQEQQEMNKTLQKVATSVDTVVGKLDHYQEDQSKRMDAVDGPNGVLEKHDKRISAVERRVWVAIGAATVLSAGASIAATLWASGH